MNHNRWLLNLLFVPAIAVCSFPIQTHAQTLSLYNAVQNALDHYPLLQQKKAELAASKAHIRTINGDKLPSLKLHDQVTLGTANGLNGSFFPMGVVVPTAGGVRDANNYTDASGNLAVSLLEWQIYNFGYYNARSRVARSEYAVSQAEYNSYSYSLTSTVVSLYLDWLKKYRLLQIEKENVKREKTILAAIKATVASGLKPGVDSSTANADYAKSYIAYLDAADNYSNDKILLATYTGMDSIAMLPDTSMFSNGVFNKMLLLQTADSIPTTQPLLDVYQKHYQEQLAANIATSRRYLPSVSFEGASWMRGSSISPEDVYASNLADGLNYNRYNYLFGLAVTYNLFDLRHRRDELAEGRYDAQAKEHALETQKANLNAALQQANTSYESTVVKLKELPLQLQSAQEAYAQQAALYKSGLNTLIDVTNSIYVLKQAETDYVLAQDEMLQLLYLKAGLSNQTDLFLQNFKH